MKNCRCSILGEMYPCNKVEGCIFLWNDRINLHDLSSASPTILKVYAGFPHDEHWAQCLIQEQISSAAQRELERR